MPAEAPDERQTIVNNLVKLLRVEADRLEVQNALRQAEAADIAEVLDDVTGDMKTMVLDSLNFEQRAEVLDEADDKDVKEYVEDRPVEELAEIANAMPPDEAVDFIAHLEQDKADALMAQLEPEHAEEVRELRDYDPETAGGIMTTEFFWAKEDETAGAVLSRLKDEVDEVETVHYIFVCRDDMKLKGQINVEDLLAAEPGIPVTQLMDEATITIGSRTDQEIAARYMQKYDLIVLPVIDSGRRLLGIITVDDILDVLSEEASEDMYRLAGVGADKPLEEGAFARAYQRLPWLVTTIVGMGLVAPFLLDSLFADTLNRIAVLALFMPAIMGLGGNAAIQSSTITVRGLGMGELDFEDLGWMLRREMSVALIVAFTCALVVGFCAYGLMASGMQGGHGTAHAVSETMHEVTGGALGQQAVNAAYFGITVGIALLFGILFSVVLGTSIPMICFRVGVDPAVAAGPFITTLIDIGTQLIYFGIATWLLLT